MTRFGLLALLLAVSACAAPLQDTQGLEAPVVIGEEAPVALERSSTLDDCAVNGDGIGGTGCPVD